MENLNKVNTISKILAGIVFIGVLVITFSIGRIYESVQMVWKKVPSAPDMKLLTNSEKVVLKTYKSAQLGIEFQYPEIKGKNIFIKEDGNKIIMTGDGYGDFEVINKNPGEVFEDAIARVEPSLISNPYCFLEVGNKNYPNTISYYISYPYSYLLVDNAGDTPTPKVLNRFLKNGSCYSNNYYIADPSIQTHFVKASHSTQSVEYMPTNQNKLWIDTLKFIPQE